MNARLDQKEAGQEPSGAASDSQAYPKIIGPNVRETRCWVCLKDH